MENQTANHAPASWQILLNRAISEPGIISAAYSAFHNYSLGNQLLAMFQCDARNIPLGPINTYKGWQALGRQVKRGERAIQLCMPITCKSRAESSEDPEHVFTRFIYRNNWFVISQTDGETAPAVTPESWDETRALENLQITRENFDHLDGNVQGYARAGRILAINPVAVMPHKTMFHEMAHIVLGHIESAQLSDGEQTEKSLHEVEAESVAYLLVNALGLPGAEFSRGYIQSWLTGSEIPEKSAQKIFKAADTILRAGKPAPAESAA